MLDATNSPQGVPAALCTPARGVSSILTGFQSAWDGARQLRTLTGTIRFSRSGRRGDTQEAEVGFVQFVPHAEGVEPLTLVTTLPVGTLREVREVTRLYH